MAFTPTQNPQPVSGGQANAGGTSGNFTFTAADVVVAAPDGTGTLVSGTPTSGSMTTAFAVADGLVGSLFLIKGLTASQTVITIYFEGSANSTNGTDGDWIELKQRRTGTQPGIETADYKTQANGYFRGNCADFKWLRARLMGTFSGTPTCQIWTSAGQGATFLNSGIPGGTSVIGKVSIDQTTPGTTNAVAVTQLPTTSSLADNHAVPTTSELGAINELTNGIGNLEKARTITGTMNQNATGLAASGMVAQLDDTSTTAITEDNFGVVRMSSRRALLVEGVASGTAIPVSLATAPTTAVTGTFWQATQPVSLATNTPTLATGANVIGSLTANQSVNTAQINGVAVTMSNGVTGTGVQRVVLTSDSLSTATVKHAVNVATGGATTFTQISAATTNAANIKASAGTLYGVQASNTGAAVAFLKIYNLAVAPTVGTSVAVKTIIIPAGSGVIWTAPSQGAAFATGIAIAVTGLATTADTTAVALAQVVTNIDYA